VHDQIRFAAKGIISYWYYHSVGVRDGMCATATKGTTAPSKQYRHAGRLVRWSVCCHPDPPVPSSRSQAQALSPINH
jgi:hypothetical protein